MGFFSSLKEKIPILSNLGGGKKSNKSSVELQYDKAMNLLENANGVGAVEVLDGITDIGMNDETYRQFGLDALNVLGELLKTDDTAMHELIKILIVLQDTMKSMLS